MEGTESYRGIGQSCCLWYSAQPLSRGSEPQGSFIQIVGLRPGRAPRGCLPSFLSSWHRLGVWKGESGIACRILVAQLGLRSAPSENTRRWPLFGFLTARRPGFQGRAPQGMPVTPA